MNGDGFVHSVKVPAIYKSGAKIVEQVLEQGGSIKQLLYSNVRKSNLRGVYALIIKTIEHNAEIETVIEKVGILEQNPRLNVHLAKILIAELVLGKQRLQGNSKPVQTILNYEQAIIEAFQVQKDTTNDSAGCAVISKPRYARVNTLRMSCDEVIKQLRGDGWQLIPLSANIDYAEWIRIVKELNEDQFLKDIHVKDLLVFPPGTEFFNYPLYQDGTIILQDKASCLPALVLAPTATPPTTVLDMCAAPGMKTTLLSSQMKGKGAVYAVEMNERRFEALQKMVTVAGCTNVHTIHGDSLTLAEDWVSQVEMVLVDPSCSGTGMTERANLFTKSLSAERIKRLSAFQFRLLMHALTGFPAARRVVYSTCSVLPQENEDIVAAVLSKLPDKQWKISTAMPNWPSRGSLDYPFGADCLTSRPADDLTTGFFIALFEKSDPANIIIKQEKYSDSIDNIEIDQEEFSDAIPKKKRKNKSLMEKEISSETDANAKIKQEISSDADDIIEIKQEKYSDANDNIEIDQDAIPKKKRKNKSLMEKEISSEPDANAKIKQKISSDADDVIEIKQEKYSDSVPKKKRKKKGIEEKEISSETSFQDVADANAKIKKEISSDADDIIEIKQEKYSDDVSKKKRKKKGIEEKEISSETSFQNVEKYSDADDNIEIKQEKYSDAVPKKKRKKKGIDDRDVGSETSFQDVEKYSNRAANNEIKQEISSDADDIIEIKQEKYSDDVPKKKRKNKIL